MTSTPSPAEPTLVFGTDLAGRHSSESATLATNLYDAGVGTASGETGYAYAIPYMNSTCELLAPDVIRNYVDPFIARAKGTAQQKYHVARFACEATAHSDEVMARMFADVPANVRLPALWNRILQADAPARLLLFDPGAHMKAAAWQDQLQRYIDLNAPLWGSAGVEVVSFGAARVVVANDVACKRIGVTHRVVGLNEAFFGKNAALAAEARAVWASTHLLSIFDFDQTGQPSQIRILGAAQRGGLAIDQINAKDVDG